MHHYYEFISGYTVARSLTKCRLTYLLTIYDSTSNGRAQLKSRYRNSATPRRLYILCWRGHSRRKLSPTLATPTTLVLTTLVAQCGLSRRKIGLLLEVVGRKFLHRPGNPATVGVVRWPAAGDTAGSGLRRLSSLHHRVYNLLAQHPLTPGLDPVGDRRQIRRRRRRRQLIPIISRPGGICRSTRSDRDMSNEATRDPHQSRVAGVIRTARDARANSARSPSPAVFYSAPQTCTRMDIIPIPTPSHPRAPTAVWG